MGETAGLSRRTLLGAGAGAGLAVAAGALGTTRATGASETRAAAAGGSLIPPERIGLQLYSVRDAIAREGFDKVLGTLAEIGYKHIEFAGYTQGTGDITLAELRGLLDKHGLKAAGSHVSASDEASMTKILDEAEILGIPYVGNSLPVPTGGPTVAGWTGVADDANRFGEMAAKRGMAYYLHNHFQEWLPCVDDPSRCGHDIFLEKLDPRFAFLQLDIFWAYVGSAQNNGRFDPLKDYAIPHRDRYPLFHCKDGVYDDAPAGTITDFGEGRIDYQTFFTELFAAAPNEEDKHLYLWERDNAADHPRGPMAAARVSYVNMRHGLIGAAGSDGADCVDTVRARLKTASVSGRRVRATLHVDEPISVAAKLTRGGTTLAEASADLRRGIRSLDLRAPRSTAAGAAMLTLALTDRAGKKKRIRRTVTL